VYLAGQVGDDMATPGIEQQTRDVLANIERLLDLAGTDKTAFTVGDDLPEGHRCALRRDELGLGQWLPKGVAPARATVEAKMCEPEILVEFHRRCSCRKPF
jgi:enamine deaminase RidA (YjgF/YER057c/UK114 family)